MNGTVVARLGEELARRVIPAGASADVVRSTLQGLLEDADREVARRAGPASGHAPYQTGIKYGQTSSSHRVRLEAHGEPADQLAEQTVLTLMTERHPIDG